MLQMKKLEGWDGYEVDFPDVPKLPLDGVTVEEGPFALALAQGIQEGMLPTPGKYVVIFEMDTQQYVIARICGS